MDEPVGRERILIDTSILIDHLRKTNKDKTIFYRLSSQYDYIISSITEFEFIVGATPANRQFTAELLSRIPVLPFDSECVKTAKDIYTELKSVNRLIALPDIFIAATAVTHELKILTLNQKHFNRIKQLKLYKIEDDYFLS